MLIVLAGLGQGKLPELAKYAPHIDAVGINAYGSMLKVPDVIAAEGWTKPYVVTEFGPRGHWEVAKTPWGLPIEDTSTEKADLYLKAYKHTVAGQPQCLGSYVFLWGQKQEKTHTWYGMFLPEGNRTASVDALSFAWTGKWPENRCPRIGPEKIRIVEEKAQAGNVTHVFPPGARLLCTVMRRTRKEGLSRSAGTCDATSRTLPKPAATRKSLHRRSRTRCCGRKATRHPSGCRAIPRTTASSFTLLTRRGTPPPRMFRYVK